MVNVTRPIATQKIAMTDSLEAAVSTSGARNPFFEEWKEPFGVPPFARIRPEHFMPAFDRAFAEHNAEMGAIATTRPRPSSRTRSPRWS